MKIGLSNGIITLKQERFCHEYLVDLNAAAAARRAGYSKRTAEVQGCRLLKNVQVKARIAELQAEAAARNEVTVDEVIAMLRDNYRDAKAANQHGPAVRAAELLGKTVGMFKDRVQIEETPTEEVLSQLRGVLPDDLLIRLAGDYGVDPEGLGLSSPVSQVGQAQGKPSIN